MSDLSYPKISIVTAVKNGEKHLLRCLDSVAAQTKMPIEHLIIDGNSTDQTPEILAKFAQKYPHVKFNSESDRGISHAFNKCWQRAIGNYVCILNADDWMEPNHIELTMNQINCFQSEIVTSHMWFESKQQKRLLIPYWSNLNNFSGKIHPRINHPGMTIKKALLAESNGYDEEYKIAMDVELFYRLLQKGPKIGIINSPTIHQWDGGISQKQVKLALQEMRKIEQLYEKNYFMPTITYAKRKIKVKVKSTISQLLPNKSRL